LINNGVKALIIDEYWCYALIIDE